MIKRDLLHAKDLCFSVGTKKILNDLSFVVQPGELVSIVGANGAGKTTLLKSFTGLIKPSSGELEVLGTQLGQACGKQELRKLRSSVGHVFQNLNLVARLTALENVLIGRLSHQRSILSWARIFPKSEIEIGREALNAVNLLHRAYDRVDRLSGGERQKIAIARALAQDAKLVLADEPTASLDPTASQAAVKLLVTLAESRKFTLITVVHSIALLPLVSRRVIGMKSGRIDFDLSVKDATEANFRDLYRAVGLTP